MSALLVLGAATGCTTSSEDATPIAITSAAPSTSSSPDVSPLATFATTKSWLNTRDGFVIHWSIELVDDDQAIGFARVSTLVSESVIDDDVRVVLTANESGSGTITFGAGDPRPVEWSDEQLIIRDSVTGDRIYTPATLEDAVVARRVLVDAANDAREEAAAPTTAASTTVAPTTVAPTTVAPTTVAPTTAAPSITPSQQQALRKAQSYLDFMAFSQEGLIKQLEYEGFSVEDATFAAGSLGADWNEQAAKKAESYLDFMAFSCQGLITQLEYEGFTTNQATHGAARTGLC